MKELEIAVIYGVTPEVDGVRQRDLYNRLRVSQHQVASGEYSGGIPGKSDQSWSERFWGVNPQDLRYLAEKYIEIIKNCIKK